MSGPNKHASRCDLGVEALKDDTIHCRFVPPSDVNDTLSEISQAEATARPAWGPAWPQQLGDPFTPEQGPWGGEGGKGLLLWSLPRPAESRNPRNRSASSWLQRPRISAAPRCEVQHCYPLQDYKAENRPRGVHGLLLFL